jgi:hypothetical protein
MRHPAYHLRPNKAVERVAFLAGIRLLGELEKLSEYTYFGFGGPYLEDFRLLYELYPEIKMISIEEDAETYKRQEFHLPCGALELTHVEFTSFLARYDAKDKKSIFWLDYTGLEYGYFEDMMVLLGKVATNSMIKVTLRAQPREFMNNPDEFRRKFEILMPDPSAVPPSASQDLAFLIQGMVEIASQRALPSALPHVFQPVSSFYYSDGTGMFTLTGVVCGRSDQAKVRSVFSKLPFANLDWEKPRKIDVPALSTKERLHVQHLLPLGNGAGRVLRRELGYLIDENASQTENKLQQYADFHRYFPYFMKATP